MEPSSASQIAPLRTVECAKVALSKYILDVGVMRLQSHRVLWDFDSAINAGHTNNNDTKGIM